MIVVAELRKIQQRNSVWLPASKSANLPMLIEFNEILMRND
jgi:hypothetical protein